MRSSDNERTDQSSGTEKKADGPLRLRRAAASGATSYCLDAIV